MNNNEKNSNDYSHGDYQKEFYRVRLVVTASAIINEGHVRWHFLIGKTQIL